MKKSYIKPTAVCIEIKEQLMEGEGLYIPVSGDTTPGNSDSKLFYDWDEEEEYDSFDFDYYWF